MNYLDLITALNEAEDLPTPMFYANTKGNGNVIDVMRKKMKLFTIYRSDRRSIELFNFRYLTPAETEIIMNFLQQDFTEWFD